MVARGLFQPADTARSSGSGRGAIGPDHNSQGLEKPIRQARAHRQVDITDLAIRVGQRRPRVRDAVPPGRITRVANAVFKIKAKNAKVGGCGFFRGQTQTLG